MIADLFTFFINLLLFIFMFFWKIADTPHSSVAFSYLKLTAIMTVYIITVLILFLFNKTIKKKNEL